MRALVVRFDLPDEAAAARFDALVAGVLPGIRTQEPGTLVYATHRVEDAPLARVFYEVYRDPEAHAAHESRPEVAAFLDEVRTLVSGVRVELLVPDEAA
ncbi:putative quinol monooxygenase [Cellulomonas endophytica]|uniref:putative quinol monooxygenase n=1 Tax=Cellulomonas endophytica TaxID=2494735 RepID=UPI0010121879|nr:antibiotic biosynthesis monooxygenase [Cellulomonas endophytica]